MRNAVFAVLHSQQAGLCQTAQHYVELTLERTEAAVAATTVGFNLMSVR